MDVRWENSGHHSQLPVLCFLLQVPRRKWCKASPAATCNHSVPRAQGGPWQQLREQRGAAQPGHPARPVLPRGTAAAPRQWPCGNGRMNSAGGGPTEATSAATSSRLSRPRSRRGGARGRGWPAASLWGTPIPPWLPMSSTFQA